MRKFTRRAASEDRVLDNVRAILIGVIIQSHATPLLRTGPAMLDVAWRPLDANWSPVQLFILRLIRGGGWSSLALLNGFDDTRAMQPYGLTYREPLFLILWLALGFQWSMWYLPAFVLMRVAFCAAHWLGLEKAHIALTSQAWILLPAFVDFYVGWQPQSPKVPTLCPPATFCPWQAWPHAQNIARYTVGWWVDSDDPVKNSMLGHGLIFIPCYWIGFYWGGSIFKVLTRIADEPSTLRRVGVAIGVFVLYLGMFALGQPVIQGYNDMTSSFWGPTGFIYGQVFKNIAYFAMNLTMSLTYVVFIAAAVPVHLKYLAKICFSSLICSAFTPCILDLPAMAVDLRSSLPAAISPGVELAWVFVVPFLYEFVVGAIFAVVLPLAAASAVRLATALGGLQP